jgi:type IV pilus assembly protein PilM
MAKKVLSVVIENEITKICEVSYSKNNANKGVRVYRSISFCNPDNTIDDGYIIDPKLYGEELRKQLKTGKLKSDKVIFSISSSKIASREIILPPTKEKKIMDIIKTGASEYFPIDIKDYILSYLVLEKKTSARKMKALKKKSDKKAQRLTKQQLKLEKRSLKKKSKTEIIAEKLELMEANTSNLSEPQLDNKTDKNVDNLAKRHLRVCIYAVPASLVKNYYSFAKTVHLDIAALDYSGNSSYQIIRRQANRGTNVYVQLNEQDTLVSILRDDILILQRTIGYGITMLTDAVLEQNYYKVNTKEEALELLAKTNLLTAHSEKKNEDVFDMSLFDEAAATGELMRVVNSSKESDEQNEKRARESIVEALHYLTGSVARMIDYYKSNHTDEQINKIYLSGAGIRIQGIEEYFFSEIGLQNKKMLKLISTGAKKKAALYRKYPGEFLTCIGAVLSPIDFIPQEFIEKKQRRSAIFATVVFSLTCIMGAAGIIYVAYSDYITAQQELSAVNKQLDELPDIDSVYQKYDQAKLELKGLEDYEAAVKSNNDQINDVILELESRLPTGAKINTMQFTKKGISMSVTAVINSSGANVLIAKLYTELEDIAYFNSVDISNDISIDESVLPHTATFTITCSYAQ